MKLGIALLGLIILTSVVVPAMADRHNIAPITVTTDASSYEDGDTVSISGLIKTLDPNFMGAVTIQVRDPNNNLVQIWQVTPTLGGSYLYILPAGGPNWKTSGEYTIDVSYNADDTTTTFMYTAPMIIRCDAGYEVMNGECVLVCDAGYEVMNGECVLVCDAGYEVMNGSCVEIPPPVVCGEGTELVDGQCQVIRPPPPPVECDAGYEIVDGECVAIPPVCGEGTELVDGQCQVIAPEGGGCLIATAAYGTELAPQVQYLREIRDGTLLSTSVGTSFMMAFNDMYYTVSPQIADLERQNPVFREVVSVAITPMLASLSLMGLAEDGSEASVLGVGMLVIALNVGMYVGVPALLGFKAYGKVRSMRLNAD